MSKVSVGGDEVFLEMDRADCVLRHAYTEQHCECIECWCCIILKWLKEGKTERLES